METMQMANFGRFDDSRSDSVSEGETYDVKIEDMGRQGDGIAKIQGLVVFVPDTKVGDEVKIRIKKVGRSAAFGERVD